MTTIFKGPKVILIQLSIIHKYDVWQIFPAIVFNIHHKHYEHAFRTIFYYKFEDITGIYYENLPIHTRF